MIYSPQAFADDSGVTVDLAKRILDLLDEKDLSPTDLNTLLWRMRDFIMKTKLPDLLEKMTDDDITGLIDQMIMERAMWQSRCPSDVCCAETEEELRLAFKEKHRRCKKAKLPESAWFFTHLSEKPENGYNEGDVVTIQIFRTGKWEHPGYGTVTIDKKVIKDVVENFKENKRGIQIAVDENHEENHRALGWYKEVFASSDQTECFAKIELTKKGAELLNDGAYKYFSPEIVFHKVDEESGDPISNLLIGGAFTNRPFFKGMQPLMATEGAAADQKNSAGRTSTSHAYFFTHHSMHKLMLLLDKLVQQDKISAAEKAELEMRYSEVPKELRSDKMASMIGEVLAKFDEDGGAPPAPEADAKPEKAKPEGDEGETKPDEEVKPEEGEAKTDGEVKANEDGSFTVDATFMESVKGMQKDLSTMSRKATLSACETKVKAMCFSDKQPTNVVLPKHVTKISAFAADLSEDKRKVFFEIIGSFKSVQAGVKGHGEDAKADFSDPTKIPATDEKVQFYTEKMGMPLDQAQKAAAAHYTAKASK